MLPVRLAWCRRLPALVFLLLVGLALTGCSKAAGAKGVRVSGKVSVDGSAPYYGSVVEFFGADAGTPAATGLVDADGNYNMNEVAPGTYQIVVKPPSAKPAAGTPGVGIPAKYGKVGNGETITVGKTNMTHNLDLKR